MSTEALNDAERSGLLGAAREAIRRELDGEPQLTAPADGTLTRPAGAFVSLHMHGDLRGCVGTFVADRPLWQTVRDMALASALRDTRFVPLTRAELDDVEIEISVLSARREVVADEVLVGTHGVYVTRGHHRGVLLPQVAVEHGWDRETFLANTCRKAGLEPDAWRERGTTVEVFTAEVFHELE